MLRTLSAATLACSLALAGCGGSAPATTASPTGPRAGTDCAELSEPGRGVHFGATIGADLYGVVLGTGHTGVVLAHMNGGDTCQWLGYGKDLADHGYRVLAFDFAGFGVSPPATAGLSAQVTAAAAYLTGDGATGIALVGASMGATAVLGAAPSTPGVVAVVSLSAPLTFGGADALDGAARLTVPVLYAAGANESTEFVDAARQLHAATRADPSNRLILVPAATEHGVYLLLPGTGTPAFQSEVAAFLAQHAPPD